MRVAISSGHLFKEHKGTDGKLYVVNDPGAYNSDYGISEAEEVENIRQELLNLIRSPYGEPGSIEAVEIPRASLQERIRIINCLHQMKPFDFVFEIHLNSALDKSISGTEVLYYPGSNRGKALGQVFLNCFQEVFKTNWKVHLRGLKARADLAFLRDTSPTALITEAEFISNSEVAKGLKEGWMQPLIALGHFLALKRIEKSEKERR